MTKGPSRVLPHPGGPFHVHGPHLGARRHLGDGRTSHPRPRRCPPARMSPPPSRRPPDPQRDAASGGDGQLVRRRRCDRRRARAHRAPPRRVARRGRLRPPVGRGARRLRPPRRLRTRRHQHRRVQHQSAVRGRTCRSQPCRPGEARHETVRGRRRSRRAADLGVRGSQRQRPPALGRHRYRRDLGVASTGSTSPSSSPSTSTAATTSSPVTPCCTSAVSTRASPPVTTAQV